MNQDKESIVGRVTNVEEREAKGKAAGKSVYFVTVAPDKGESLELSTFSETLHVKAEQAEEEGTEVEAWFTEKTYNGKIYRNLERLELDDFDAGPGSDPADSMAGEGE